MAKKLSTQEAMEECRSDPNNMAWLSKTVAELLTRIGKLERRLTEHDDSGRHVKQRVAALEFKEGEE